MLTFSILAQDVFDLPFHLARDQIESSLRTKMSSIKVKSFHIIEYSILFIIELKVVDFSFLFSRRT